MNINDALEVFSREFVLPDFQERFLHEATKKPRKLHERVSHQISELFPSIYRGRAVVFYPDTQCIIFAGGAAAEQLPWREAAKKVGYGGILIIEISGRRFYAETEGAPKVEVWAGEC